jgi:hypothetical protein
MTDQRIERNEANDAIMEQFIFNRELVLTCFSQVEWFMAKILVEAHAFPEYSSLNLDFSIQAESRAKKLRSLLAGPGPLQKHGATLSSLIDEMMKYSETRNFMAHGVCVAAPSTAHGVVFRLKMFKRMPGAADHEGKIDFTVDQLVREAQGISDATKRFINQMRTIWVELGMKNFDVEF